jgi:hypothetical protein
VQHQSNWHQVEQGRCTDRIRCLAERRGKINNGLSQKNREKAKLNAPVKSRDTAGCWGGAGEGGDEGGFEGLLAKGLYSATDPNGLTSSAVSNGFAP